MKLKIKENHRLWLKFTLIFFFIQILLRLVLVLDKPPGLIDSLDALIDGFAWDLGTWLILSLPLLLATLLIPARFHQKFFHSKLNHLLTLTFSLVFGFIALCEIIFWNEFHSRFNFIAVDYLIYTNEVLSNLQESYPMGKIFSGLVVFSLGITYAFSKLTFEQKLEPSFLNKKTAFALLGISFPLVFVLSIGPWLENHDENFKDDQISRNGIYEFARAFRSNQIDYKAFYPTIPKNEMDKLLLDAKVNQNPVAFDLPIKKPNVVFIVVESLGAKFIGPLSNNKDTTPYLNALAEKSIFFENFYSTGTRTVRGLEALTLSVPPTPGYAVVKRPDHKNLFSMGHTFAENGYDSTFLYGGRGFFDNMNSFFSGNQFKIVDQQDFSKDEVTFSNAWGVCDEDLFKKAEKHIEGRDKTKPFLLFMLTTSNHRPFTYPDNKIDIASGESRAGAVKYTDYAIGKFLDDVKDRDWAKETIFIVVADHSTEGRGRFDLEMKDFHIPLWIYSPALIKPMVVTKLGSQIDLLPTLIHILGLKDNSPFYGQNLLNPNWTEERAFIGNYQYVGFYKNKVLTTLGPNRMVRNYSFDPKSKKQGSIKDSPYLNEGISYYQSASFMLDKGLYKYKNDTKVFRP